MIKTGSPIYVRFFKSPKMEEKLDMKMSTYFPDKMKDGLVLGEQLNIFKKDDYILGPIYAKVHDFQIGVTGSLEEREKAQEGMTRELGEEIGLIPYTYASLETLVEAERKAPKPFKVFALSIKHALPVPESQDKKRITSSNKVGKDTKRKVGCFLYGSKEELLAFLQTEKIFRYYNTDKIVGVGAIKLSDINLN